MSALDFTGIYCPYTGESNVNVDSPACLLPSTAAHELAHQRSIALEQECNFLAILACTTCGNEENRSKRAEIKQLIQTLKVKNPEVEAHIFRSVENVNVDTVIAYKKHGKKISFLEEYDHAEPAEGNGSPLPASGGIAGKPGLPGNELAKHCGNLPAAGIEKS